MANHSKNRSPKDQAFAMRGEGTLHRPKQHRDHVSQELIAHDRDSAENLIRRLTPSAKDRVLGKKIGTHKHEGWHPTGGRSLTRMETNIRGGMIG